MTQCAEVLSNQDPYTQLAGNIQTAASEIGMGGRYFRVHTLHEGGFKDDPRLAVSTRYICLTPNVPGVAGDEDIPLIDIHYQRDQTKTGISRIITAMHQIPPGDTETGKHYEVVLVHDAEQPSLTKHERSIYRTWAAQVATVVNLLPKNGNEAPSEQCWQEMKKLIEWQPSLSSEEQRQRLWKQYEKLLTPASYIVLIAAISLHWLPDQRVPPSELVSPPAIPQPAAVSPQEEPTPTQPARKEPEPEPAATVWETFGIKKLRSFSLETGGESLRIDQYDLPTQESPMILIISHANGLQEQFIMGDEDQEKPLVDAVAVENRTDGLRTLRLTIHGTVYELTTAPPTTVEEQASKFSANPFWLAEELQDRTLKLSSFWVRPFLEATTHEVPNTFHPGTMAMVHSDQLVYRNTNSPTLDPSGFTATDGTLVIAIGSDGIINGAWGDSPDNVDSIVTFGLNDLAVAKGKHGQPVVFFPMNP